MTNAELDKIVWSLIDADMDPPDGAKRVLRCVAKFAGICGLSLTEMLSTVVDGERDCAALVNERVPATQVRRALENVADALN